MPDNSGETYCAYCMTLVEGPHALENRHHLVIHVSIFPAYRRLKDASE